MIKMVVSDMDGTLLNEKLEISERNLQAIEYLRKKDIRFCIATGRPEQLVKEYIDKLNMKDPMIMYNGSVIGHPFIEKNIYELSLRNDDIKEIVRFCESLDVIYMLYTKNQIFSKPNYRVDFFEERNQNLQEKDRCVFKDERDIDLIIENNNVNKILIIENDSTKYQMLKEKFEREDKFTVATSQKGFIDINPKGASKGNALKFLADYYGYSLQDVAVLGDQDNDISMLVVAGMSVVMENGSEEAKKSAKAMTKSNKNDGFAEWVFKNL